MANVEVTLTDRLDTEIDRLVEEGDFLNREQVVEEILTAGLSAYSTTESTEDTLQEAFLQSTSEQQDPAMQEAAGDDYTF